MIEMSAYKVLLSLSSIAQKVKAFFKPRLFSLFLGFPMESQVLRTTHVCCA